MIAQVVLCNKNVFGSYTGTHLLTPAPSHRSRARDILLRRSPAELHHGTGRAAPSLPPAAAPREVPRPVTDARGMSGLTIAYIITKASPIGGAQIHVRDLAAAVAAQGHAPTVITSFSSETSSRRHHHRHRRNHRHSPHRELHHSPHHRARNGRPRVGPKWTVVPEPGGGRRS